MATSWSAPGRVNLIGEHVDYNDGLVLPFALPHVTTADVSQADGHVVSVTSAGEQRAFPVDAQRGEVVGWAAYVAGVVWALRALGVEVPGLSIDITSDVPVGAGLSSSAALECAVGCAVADHLGLRLDPREVAHLAHVAEHDFVGVPSGPMDQLVSMLGRDGHALLIDCRDLTARPVPLDLESAGLVLLVIDTRVRRELVAGEYAARRQECEEARTTLGVASMRDTSREDLARIEDPVVRRRAHHVVTEIARVSAVASILESGRPGDIGAYLTASHESLRDDFAVSCDELDAAVDAALEAGALGARMTGAGFGGCAIALVRNEDVQRVSDAVRAAYEALGWRPPTVFATRPSAGARRSHRA